MYHFMLFVLPYAIYCLWNNMAHLQSSI